MACYEQNSYEGFLSSYRINIQFIQTKLTIVAEHRQTKKVWRTEINRDAISTITKGVCETCEHLFELLRELIDNDGKCSNKTLEVIEQETKVILNLTIVVVFGRTSRGFTMQFDLESVQLDDITRLENIINEHAQRLEQLEWSANDRFDRATKLTSLWENEFQFRNLSPIDHIIFSDNARTICCKTQTTTAPSGNLFGSSPITIVSVLPGTSRSAVAPTGKEAIVIANQGFLLSTNKRYQLIRFNLHFSGPLSDDTVFFGVVYQPDDKKWSKIMSSNDVWLLNISNGFIQYSPLDARPYTRSIKTFNQESEKQLNTTSHVDLLFDTYHRCLAFRINDQTEDQWAFYLPKHLQINQLYPLVILNNSNISVSIDF